MRRSYSLSTKWKTAVHEAGHAVIAHLVGVEIDHVTIIPKGGTVGHSSPVRAPAAIAAQKLWDEATAIRRTLVYTEYKGGKWDGRRWVGGRHVYKLRKGYRPECYGHKRTQNTPAPQALVKRMDDLRAQANALWKEADDSLTRKDRVKGLMHTFGGPVADCVFFNAPLEAPRYRCRTPEEMEARNGIGPLVYLYAGNSGAGSDFRSIRRQLKHIDDSPSWKETREHYRRKAEKLVRKHRAMIERVAKTLLKRKTLTGAQLVKIIERGQP
jgi:hypothetical protein